MFVHMYLGEHRDTYASVCKSIVIFCRVCIFIVVDLCIWASAYKVVYLFSFRRIRYGSLNHLHQIYGLKWENLNSKVTSYFSIKAFRALLVRHGHWTAIDRIASTTSLSGYDFSLLHVSCETHLNKCTLFSITYTHYDFIL